MRFKKENFELNTKLEEEKGKKPHFGARKYWITEPAGRGKREKHCFGAGAQSRKSWITKHAGRGKREKQSSGAGDQECKSWMEKKDGTFNENCYSWRRNQHSREDHL